jgi:hypothetical protein
MASSDTTSGPFLHVLHIITDLKVGGAEIYLTQLLESPRDRNMDASVICLTSGDPEIMDRLDRAGVSVLELGISRRMLSLGSLIRLLKSIRQYSPDVIVSWLYHADYLTFLACILTRTPVRIWNVRCSYLDMRYYNRTTAIIRWLLARLSRFTDAVICNSHAGLHAHFDLGYRPLRWSVVPSGFQTNLFAPNLWLPNIPAGRIRRDSEGCDMISIHGWDHESVVVDLGIATQVA